MPARRPSHGLEHGEGLPPWPLEVSIQDSHPTISCFFSMAVSSHSITLSAATTCGALAVIFAKDGTYYAWATAAVSFLSVALNTYMTDLDPGQAAQKHRETAADLCNIRECLQTSARELAWTLFGTGETSCKNGST
jgi:hypothetical protein